MSGMPWFQFYASDWLAGTRGLSAVETGIFITLIASMYDRGSPLPNDQERLARLCGATAKQFKPAMQRLVDEGKVIITEDGVWNARVDEQIRFRATKSDKAKLSAESRWSEKTEEKQCEADANASQTQCERNANQKPYTRSTVVVDIPSIKPTPPNPEPSPPPNDTGQDQFDKLDNALRQIPGVSNHPIFSAPVIAPIWQLVQSGFDFKTEIRPIIADRVSKTPPGRIKSWSFFVDAITQGRANGKAVSTQAASSTNWPKALNTARLVKRWKSQYGPMPGQDGCLVPKHLLERGDGEGWVISDQMRAA